MKTGMKTTGAISLKIFDLHVHALVDGPQRKKYKTIHGTGKK